MKIKLSDLEKKPCRRYYDYIIENYGEGEFDPLEVINKLEGHSYDVGWLMINCKKAQTPEAMEYYKRLKPGCKHIRWLIINCKFAQTAEMLDYYKGLKPGDFEVRSLITLLNAMKKAVHKSRLNEKFTALRDLVDPPICP